MKVPFKDIRVGTIFVSDNVTHVKIEPVCNEYGAPSNALALSRFQKDIRDSEGKFICRYTSNLFYFTDNTPVLPDHRMSVIDAAQQ